MSSVRVQCDQCGEWLATDSGEEEAVACDCGNVYAVTVTKIRDSERALP